MTSKHLTDRIVDLINYDGGNLTFARSVAAEILDAIPAPERPTEPDLEYLGSIPDQEHIWGDDWEQEPHYGRICSTCDLTSECAHCGPLTLNGADCLREQARARNFKLTCAHNAAVQRYEAQMDYYHSLTGGTA